MSVCFINELGSVGIISFNNMLLRVPGSLNSSCIQFDDKGRIIDIPYDARVRIEKYWDGNTPTEGRVLS